MAIGEPTSAVPPDPLPTSPGPGVFIVYVSGAEADSLQLRAQLVEAIKSQADQSAIKVNVVSLKEINGYFPGDLLIFPNMIKYSSVNVSDISSLFGNVFVEKKDWKSAAIKLSGIYMFVRVQEDLYKAIFIENPEAPQLNIAVSKCRVWKEAKDFIVFSSKQQMESTKNTHEPDVGIADDGMKNVDINHAKDAQEPDVGNSTNPQDEEEDNTKEDDNEHGDDENEPSAPRKLYMCYGTLDSWSFLGLENSEELPVVLGRCLSNAGVQVEVTFFDNDGSPEFDHGDVVIFPNRFIYRALTPAMAPEFVQRVLIGNEGQGIWFSREDLEPKSFVFVCCEQTRTQRVCSVSGPLLLQRFKEEIHNLNLADVVSCYASTHPERGVRFASEVILYTDNNENFLYERLEPREAQTVLIHHFMNPVAPRKET